RRPDSLTGERLARAWPHSKGPSRDPHFVYVRLGFCTGATNRRRWCLVVSMHLLFVYFAGCDADGRSRRPLTGGAGGGSRYDHLSDRGGPKPASLDWMSTGLYREKH